jgi:hypothetical protein
MIKNIKEIKSNPLSSFPNKKIITSKQNSEYWDYDYNVPYKKQVIDKPTRDGLILEYLFSEKDTDAIYDSSGNNHFGFLSDKTTFKLLDAPIGNSFCFDGTANYINTNYVPSQSLTISCWAKGNILNAASTVLFGQTTTDNRLYVGYDADGKLGIGIGTSAYNTDSVSSYIDKEWHHYVLTVSSSSSNLYLDGILMITKNVATMPTNTIYIGANNNAGAAATFFYGQIALFRVYNRILSL